MPGLHSPLTLGFLEAILCQQSSASNLAIFCHHSNTQTLGATYQARLVLTYCTIYNYRIYIIIILTDFPFVLSVSCSKIIKIT